MKLPSALLTLCAGLLLAGALPAQVLANRAALSGRLNSSVTEDFEGYSIAPANGELLWILSLDENSLAGGQGPGLVLDGCTYSCNDTCLQWNGPQYYGTPSKTLVSDASDGVLTLTYDAPMSGVGFDLLAYQGSPDSVIVTVYDWSGAVIHTSAPISVPGPSPVFFGYQAAAIGKVTIDSQVNAWSSLIDDHQYGRSGPTLTMSGACPGPAVLTVSGVTAGARIVLGFAGSLGSFAVPPSYPCSGTVLGLGGRPIVAGMMRAQTDVATLSVTLPPGACGGYLQALVLTTCTTTNVLQL